MGVRDMLCFEESTSTTSAAPLVENSSLLVSSSSDDEINKCCNHVIMSKCELVDYDSLPHFLKHNEFVLSYYRSEWPLKQTIHSIFAIHNETLNVWTHLIGFFIFLALTCTAMMVAMDGSMPSSSSLQHSASIIPSTFNVSHSLRVRYHDPLIPPPLPANLTSGATEQQRPVEVQPVARWPFYAYLCGAMFCLLMSSACHLLSCHSEHTCYVMLRLDFAGISALIVTSFYPLVYYSFACDPFFQHLYIGFITVFGIATILVSMVPIFETPEFRFVRAGLFAGMAVSGLVPILHKAIVFGHRPEAAITTGYEVMMLALYGLGVVVYVARVPERWMPGRFDLVGHSHQLFHVLVIAGAYTHYLAGIVYLQWREMEGC